jgi:hypothetical protein
VVAVVQADAHDLSGQCEAEIVGACGHDKVPLISGGAA